MMMQSTNAADIELTSIKELNTIDVVNESSSSLPLAHWDWYYLDGMNPLGPFLFSDLTSFPAITKDTLVWCEELGDD